MAFELSGGRSRSVLAFAVASFFALSVHLAAAQTPAPAEPAKPVDPDTVLATVNGVKLTERDVQLAIGELRELNPAGGALDDQRRAQVLDYLINVKLVAQAAEQAKMADAPDFQARLGFLREQVLMKSYLEKVGADAVTDDAIKQVYNDTVKDMKPEQEVRARHILVETEDDAKKVVERLGKGEDFAAVAKEISKDPGSGAEGGELGFFTKEQMVPEFADAAFKLEVGKVSAPVKSQYGWHIIEVEEKRERPVPTLDEVRGQIEEYVNRRAQQDAVKKLLDQAKIERTEAPKKAEEPAAKPQ